MTALALRAAPARKICPDCGHRHDRVSVRCADCAARRQTVAAYQRQYRERNRETVAAKQRQYYERNRETVAAKKRQYYERNRETVAAYQRQCRAAGHVIEYQGRGRPPVMCAACRQASRTTAAP
ncbi:MAG: hypothetical protein IT356_12540 [Gemmatimonadaceae bacterium]|nr:hypothetical protein [Gemmatimonadaceae bacterium]